MENKGANDLLSNEIDIDVTKSPKKSLSEIIEQNLNLKNT